MTVSQFVGLGGKTKKDRQKGMKRLCSLLQRLDYDTTQWSDSELVLNCVEAADELTENKPGVRLSLSVWGEQKDRLGIDVVGMVSNSAPKASSSKAAPKKSSNVKLEGYKDLGVKADEGDEDAEAELTKEAEEKSIDPDEYESWEDLGAELDSLLEAAENANEDDSDSDEDMSEYVGYEAVFNNDEIGEFTVTTTGYNETTGLFTVEDEEENTYECEFSDLTFDE